jgi:tetratricopeptide (TPR) repeat protein
MRRANSAKCTDVQKSHALELAAGYARGQKKPGLAAQLIARIPIPAVQKTARMQHLLDQFQAAQVVAQFAGEDIGAWPFCKRGEGFAARGRAQVVAKNGGEARADLTRALEWLSDPRLRDDVLLNLAQNAVANLHDDDAALASFHQIIDNQKHLGSATQFDAVHGIATILSKRGRHDEALAALKLVDHEQLQGVWRERFRQWTKELEKAAGR